jgi:hypothetical protein
MFAIGNPYKSEIPIPANRLGPKTLLGCEPASIRDQFSNSFALFQTFHSGCFHELLGALAILGDERCGELARDNG